MFVHVLHNLDNIEIQSNISNINEAFEFFGLILDRVSIKDKFSTYKIKSISIQRLGEINDAIDPKEVKKVADIVTLIKVFKLTRKDEQHVHLLLEQ